MKDMMYPSGSTDTSSRGHEPLRHVGHPMEKVVLDKSLHAYVGDVGAIPRLHGRQVWGNKSFTDGGRARTEEQGFHWQRRSEGKRFKALAVEKRRRRGYRLHVPKGGGNDRYLQGKVEREANCLPRLARLPFLVTSPFQGSYARHLLTALRRAGRATAPPSMGYELP